MMSLTVCCHLLLVSSMLCIGLVSISFVWFSWFVCLIFLIFPWYCKLPPALVPHTLIVLLQLVEIATMSGLRSGLYGGGLSGTSGAAGKKSFLFSAPFSSSSSFCILLFSHFSSLCWWFIFASLHFKPSHHIALSLACFPFLLSLLSFTLQCLIFASNLSQHFSLKVPSLGHCSSPVVL